MLILTTACATYQITPRQNFDAALRDFIGRDLSKYENFPGNLSSKNKIISSRLLPSGNVENFYKLLSPAQSVPPTHCIYVLEFDPRTKIVVAARIDSGHEVCAIRP